VCCCLSRCCHSRLGLACQQRHIVLAVAALCGAHGAVTGRAAVSVQVWCAGALLAATAGAQAVHMHAGHILGASLAAAGHAMPHPTKAPAQRTQSAVCECHVPRGLGLAGRWRRLLGCCRRRLLCRRCLLWLGVNDGIIRIAIRHCTGQAGAGLGSPRYTTMAYATSASA